MNRRISVGIALVVASPFVAVIVAWLIAEMIAGLFGLSIQDPGVVVLAGATGLATVCLTATAGFALITGGRL